MDVLVVGAGPAGWAAAAACAQAGLRVQLLAPAPTARWTHTYGAWADELAATGLPPAIGHEWDVVLVRTVGTGYRDVGRSYALLDNDRLAALLRERAGATGIVVGRARHVAADGDRAVVTTTDGTRLSARAVVDATGHPGVFRRGRLPALAQQTAYGLVARFATPPIPPGSMCLMDFAADAFDDRAVPTFLYAMDLGDGWYFVEETALAARPAVPIARLRARLERRLAARGSVVGEVRNVERVAFAMDAPVPPPGPAVPFGAAAAMVHPATGYHVAAVLRRAPALAAALRSAVSGPGDARAVAEAGRQAVWRGDDRRRDALYRFGLDVLLALDTPATQAFFDGFFSLPPQDWQGYVSRTSTPLQVQRTMLRLMSRVPARVRGQVMRAVVAQRSWRRLAPAVLGR